ncbi:MAG: hypothetical protein RIR11_4450 [Bacteroidota bacterium]|jgi:hypothetical protein
MNKCFGCTDLQATIQFFSTDASAILTIYDAKWAALSIPIQPRFSYNLFRLPSLKYCTMKFRGIKKTLLFLPLFGLFNLEQVLFGEIRSNLT